MERRLLSIEELSEYLGVGAQTIRNRLCNGTFPIPAKKVCGRVKFDSGRGKISGESEAVLSGKSWPWGVDP